MNQVKDQIPGLNSFWPFTHSSLFLLQSLCTGQKAQPFSVATRSSSRLKSRRGLEQGGQDGINAWKRWTLWRQSQTNLYLVSGASSLIFLFICY